MSQALAGKLVSINPSNYQPVGEVDVSTPDEVGNKVWQAREARHRWAKVGVAERVGILRNAVAEFERRKEEIALLETREMGKPITAALAESGDQAAFATWYLDNAARCLASETTTGEHDAEVARVSRAPLGAVAAILPWNYPFLMFIWKVFPNLLAGNTVVMKHSEQCPLMGKLIEEVMTAHLPEGVFNEVYGGGQTGELLVQKNVDLIDFTGSKRTGQHLFALAGKKFIRSVMELGGSAPGIVFEDADQDAAVASIKLYRLSNAGQYCDGLKRLIVHESVHDELVRKLVEAFRAVKVGNAEDPATEMGPVVSKRQLEALQHQVARSLQQGAEAATGGFSAEAEFGGAFYPPTILTKVTDDMPVWCEEVFGPVLPVRTFRTEDEAIALANDTEYGLGGYVYTADLDRAERVADALETGMVSINGANYTTPFNPFGGWKNSGMGREHGTWGFHELTQVKVVARPK